MADAPDGRPAQSAEPDDGPRRLLRAATIGEPTRASTARSTSPTTTRPGRALYEREAARVRSLLGDRVRLLEHVGSTSVPGLAAKPIIDIDAGGRRLGRRARLRPAMEAGGYVLRDPRARLVRAPAVQGPGHRHQPARLLRRARPRSTGCSPSATGCGPHDDERELYLRTKRELAARDWVYVQDYADAKGEVVEAIIARATGRAPMAPAPR